MILSRFFANPIIAEWLARPTNCFSNLPERVLLVSGRESNWTQCQLLRAILHSSLQLSNTRVIIFDLTLPNAISMKLSEHTQLMIANNSPMNSAISVLTTTLNPEPSTVRFLSHDLQLLEHLALLREGESLLRFNDNTLFARWKGE